MKKFFSFIILISFWINNLFAETINLDQGIKINIPKGYEHLNYDQSEFMRYNLESLEISKSKIDEIIDQTITVLGMNGSETSTIIGRKGFVKGYGDFINHTLSGNPPETWYGFGKLERQCGNKKTEKSMLKCLVKFFKMDPIVQIDVSNGTTVEIKELSSLMQELNFSDKKDVKDFNKASEKIKQTFSDMYQNELKIKLGNIKNKKWGFEILGKDIMMGFTAQRVGYLFIHNERPFIVQGFCMSETTCKNIKKLNNQIIEPYLSKKLVLNNKGGNISDDTNLTEKLISLNELYKSGALTKEEFEKAKKKILD